MCPGRNDPCPCGSGLKFKKCCMNKEGGPAPEKIIRPSGKVLAKWIKKPHEVEGMRRAGRFNGELMDYIREYVKPGVSTKYLDNLVCEYTRDHGHIPACLNYRGFKGCSCISINEVVCHGVPGEKIILRDGDIVNVDLTTIVQGYYADQSETFLLGNVSPTARRLVEVTADSMIEAIAGVAPDVSFARIGDLIEEYVQPRGFSVVVDFTGHGLGRSFHEDPPIYHFKNSETKPYLLAPGMTFTIEPMINEGTWKVEVDPRDGWTVRTLDRKLSAQFEHTVLVTEKGFEILTLTPSQIKARKICFLASHPKNSF